MVTAASVDGSDDGEEGRVEGSEARAATATPPTGATWEPPRWLDQTAGWIWRLGLLGFALWAFFRLFGMFQLVTVPILFALILTSLFWPIRQLLVGWRLPEFMASWTVILLVLGSLLGVFWLATAGVLRQLDDSANWTETRTEVEDWLIAGPLGLSAQEVDEIERRLEDTLRSGAASFGTDGARSVTEEIGSMLLTAVLVFFFVKDGPSLWSSVVDRVRPSRREAVAAAGDAAFEALSGYARGVTLTGVVDAVLIGAVLVILGVPLAVPLALLTFFAAYVPIVGATVVGALSVVVTLVSLGMREAIIVGVATLIIQQVEGDIVMPLVMGTQTRLHPAVILTVLAAGAAVAGLIGALVAVPLTAMASAGVRCFSGSGARLGVETADTE